MKRIRVLGLAAPNLRGEVGLRASFSHGGVVVYHKVGQAKVRDLALVLLVQQNVLQLQISARNGAEEQETDKRRTEKERRKRARLMEACLFALY